MISAVPILFIDTVFNYNYNNADPYDGILNPTTGIIVGEMLFSRNYLAIVMTNEYPTLVIINSHDTTWFRFDLDNEITQANIEFSQQ